MGYLAYYTYGLPTFLVVIIALYLLFTGMSLYNSPYISLQLTSRNAPHFYVLVLPHTPTQTPQLTINNSLKRT